MASPADYINQVQSMYLSYYGRFADKAGLDYWTYMLDANGGNLDGIIQAFGTSAEATALYPATLSTAQKVTNLYNSLFGRDPDAAGLTFYTNLIGSGQATLVDIAKRVFDGATAEDANRLANKVNLANELTSTIGASNTYSGAAAAATARALMSNVTNDPATKTTVGNAMTQAVNSAFSTGTAITSISAVAVSAADTTAPLFSNAPAYATATTLTLTASETGTAGLYNATSGALVGSTVAAASGAVSTLTVAAQAGVTTTNVKLVDSSNNVNVHPTINVILGTTGADTIANVTGRSDIIYGFGGGDTFQILRGDMANTTLVGAAGSTDIVEVTVASTAIVDADFAKFRSVETLKLTGASSAVLGTNATAAGITTVVAGAGATTVTSTQTAITVDLATAHATSLTTGAASANYTVSGDAATTAITATGSSGTLAITAANATGDALAIATGSGNVTVTGGHSSDTITVTGMATASQSFNASTAASNITITAGAGAQTITTGTGTNNITGGAGADTINITASSAAVDTLNYASGDSTVAGMDVVTGFNAAATNADILNLVATALVGDGKTGDGSGAEDITVGAVTIGAQTVATGIVTFQAADTLTLVPIASADAMQAALTYLGVSVANGSTVAFEYNYGGNSGTIVFQGDAAGDTVINLAGVTGITALATAAGANTILIA